MTAFEQAFAIGRLGLPTAVDGEFPAAHWEAFRAAGVIRWTIPTEFGGLGSAVDDVLAGSIELARADLVSTFVLSQFQSACSRFVASSNRELKSQWLPRLASGHAFATIGISHLTTSRQHASAPPVLAETAGQSFRVSGEIPWVTSGAKADVLVAGATLEDHRQILFAVPTTRSGVEVAPHWPLVALTGSWTGPVTLTGVEIHEADLLAGPVLKVLQQGQPGGAGSLNTSALATGHALRCVDAIAREAVGRPALNEIVEAFTNDLATLRDDLLANSTGRGTPDHTAETLRARATSLALTASQALMTASKGAGFLTGHPAGRLAREALFFLVWSCPQAVSSRLLREFSQCDLDS